MQVLDTLVVGKGPAALAAAAALAEHGLRVGLLGPAGDVHWPAEYGAWADELAPADRFRLAQHTWSEAAVISGDGRHVLPRAYVRIDKHRLRDDLLDRCARGGVRWLDGRARQVRHDSAGSRVVTADGAEIPARLVVDCSGHRPSLVKRESTRSQGYQTAFGGVLDYSGPLFPDGQALLMDWSDRWMPDAERAAAQPSFLYAMPLGDGRLFVEETVLVGRPAVAIPALERRLHLRMSALGIPSGRLDAVERCWIPMGGPLPDLRQRVVGFGGAAAMVHPATGYMLARVLRCAPDLAHAVASELGRSGAEPAAAAAAAWRSVWPADHRHRYRAFRFGMEALLRLGPDHTRAFFDGFFRLPAPQWQGYLSDRLSAAELHATMARLFLNLPNHVRRRLAGTVFSRPGVDFARSLLAHAGT